MFTRALCVIAIVLCAATGRAQPLRPFAALEQRLFDGRDSVRLMRALPEGPGARPALIVLSDRYGEGTHMRTMLSVFAQQGFRAWLLPIRRAGDTVAARRRVVSAGSRTVRTGQPAELDLLRDPVLRDSANIARIALLLADITGEEGCDGRAVLFAMDDGARAGMLAASRLPLFAAVALLSPVVDSSFEHALSVSSMPSLLIFGADDPERGSSRVQHLREELLERIRRIDAKAFKDTRRYFFNATHRDFRKESFNAAVNESLRLFRSVLRR